ncbi:AEC family transporter [Variovorax sp. J22P240]|uniref:AEC family transporter n=1 Tax=unclassified Variovorax TaxID=663243 RepID=UPI0025780175|nr:MULTISPECIES: AEC family transporter [unclassified Variovorax]MDL9998845.1 AEC family transporter [Variovorax sp. J22P240]MDM0050651.1 AEC family transporter [Variovorax sp. J22R115]
MPRGGYPRTVNYAQLLFPDFSLIACGWLLCRYTALDRRVWNQVESLVYYFLFPVLLFHSIVRSPLDFGATSNLLTAGVGVGLSGIALAYALPFLPAIGAHIDRRDHAASAQIAFRFNSFICLALADRVAGPEGLLMIAVLIGVCVPMFNIAAVWPMTRHAQTGFVRQLARNPLIIATVTGLIANVLGLGVPTWLEPTLTRIGAASLALGLMAAGAGMQFATLAQGKVLAVSVLAIRHLVLPLIGWGLAIVLKLDPAQAAVLMTFSAVPTASSAYVLAARMGYNGAYVAGLVTLSTLLGVLSLPFALALTR